jgi:hypothetical protein
VEFGLEKCARVSVKSGRVHRRQHIGKMEDDIKELVYENIQIFGCRRDQ